MKNYIVSISLLFSIVVTAQNYSVAFEGLGYVDCDELEEIVIQKTKFNKGWDDYELDSSFLKSIKYYYHEPSNYWFSIVKFKSDETYVYCGIPLFEVGYFEVFLELKNYTAGELFNEYISPYKCDCK